MQASMINQKKSKNCSINQIKNLNYFLIEKIKVEFKIAEGFLGTIAMKSELNLALFY